MKRLGFAFAGVTSGLLLTWICLYLASHVQLRLHTQGPASGCHELGECPVSSLHVAILIAYLFGPAIALGTLNAIAWHRWRPQTWAWRAAVVTLLAISTYLVDRLFFYGP